ncbi:hypothetical protein Curi_c19670 [Gottschalkia acidurici 9a]|uniref:Uncharacterized protein n=1 Tax=Gottschalkia acidurici (strain ATCC 7906 / DSM 604 / BCRC 14475 / CIP 104303 / KCTC 5404 / NCIMB 10678 / 9a) TaxID=1128398 RepID=K0B2X7_GOTA9|nr:hypothetical protein [Gottschalkia acidurici]AFS78971.1 hypothetical protein Curi_c19670 [Gottschalkia acidurici 9a]
MNKALDIIICLLINSFSFILWGLSMIISSDIPVKISTNEARIMSLLIIIFFICYSIYLKTTKYISLNMSLLLMPLALWFVSMQQALTYHYHKYSTAIDTLGFSITFIIFTQLVYREFKNKKDVRL